MHAGGDLADKAQLQAELTAVNALILEILSRRATSGEWNGRQYTLHNLSELKDFRDAIEAELGQVDAGGRSVRTIVPRG